MLRSTDSIPFKAFRTHIALDEDLESSALGMFYGFDYNSVNTSLQRQNIPMRSWNAVKSIIYHPELFTSSIQYQDLCMLDHIFEYGMEENDYGSLLYGFLLLKYLTNPSNKF